MIQSPYVITKYTKQKAKELGVVVKLSTKTGKKIDVFKNDVKIASVGASGYADYPTYVKTHGAEYAESRRILYRLRHESDRHKPNTAGFYADNLLW